MCENISFSVDFFVKMYYYIINYFLENFYAKGMVTMKKLFSLLLTAVMALMCFTACGGGDEEAPEAPAYSGILTKIKLGMPLTKIVSLQPDGVDLYYETDTCVWSINPDTDLMEIRNLLPEGEQFYYVDDSIITYNFKTVKGDENIYLNDYVSEVHCLLDRDTARKYFDSKTAELAAKHGVEAVGTQIGTEDIDMEITFKQTFNCTSYTLTFTMVEKYDTVNGVDGYYGSFFSIDVKEKEVKDETEIQTGATEKEKEKEAETEAEKEE